MKGAGWIPAPFLMPEILPERLAAANLSGTLEPELPAGRIDTVFEVIEEIEPEEIDAPPLAVGQHDDE